MLDGGTGANVMMVFCYAALPSASIVGISTAKVGEDDNPTKAQILYICNHRNFSDSNSTTTYIFLVFNGELGCFLPGFVGNYRSGNQLPPMAIIHTKK